MQFHNFASWHRKVAIEHTASGALEQEASSQRHNVLPRHPSQHYKISHDNLSHDTTGHCDLSVLGAPLPGQGTKLSTLSWGGHHVIPEGGSLGAMVQLLWRLRAFTEARMGCTETAVPALRKNLELTGGA